MRDVRLLRTFLDGKIPAVTANDNEQLRILISKCKKNVGIAPDTDVDAWANNTASDCDISPIKNKDKEQRTERTDQAECFDQRSKKKTQTQETKENKKVQETKKRTQQFKFGG